MWFLACGAVGSSCTIERVLAHGLEPPAHALASIPSGWYAVAFSHELAKGQVRPIDIVGRKAVLFRTNAGVAVVMDAHCPHLGAHLGYGGRVEGETIRCPFHGFCYDGAGACVSSPYPRLPKVRALTWPSREIHGVILAYHDDHGQPPVWQVPDLDMTGWSRLITKQWIIPGNPQDTTENSVDVGHFSAVHGYLEVHTLKEASVDGPYLNARYSMIRPAGFPGRRTQVEFEVHVHGLGYSMVDSSVPAMGIVTRQFVLATPIDAERIELRLALAIREGTRPKIINRLLALYGFASFTADTKQDFVIWAHRRQQAPSLADGDGPIGRYRKWARQFYR